MATRNNSDFDVGYLEQLQQQLPVRLQRAEERGIPLFCLDKILADIGQIPTFAISDLDCLRNFGVQDCEMAQKLRIPIQPGRLFVELSYKVVPTRVVLHVVDVTARRNSTFAAPLVVYGKNMSKRGCFVITAFASDMGEPWRPRANVYIVNKHYVQKEMFGDDDDEGGETISYQVATLNLFAKFRGKNDHRQGNNELRHVLNFLNALCLPDTRIWNPLVRDSTITSGIYSNYCWLVANNAFLLST